MHQDGPSVSVRTGGRAVAYYRDILTLASHTTAGKDEPTRPSGERPLPAHHDAVVLALGGGQQRDASEAAPRRRPRAQHLPQLGHCLATGVRAAHGGNRAQLPSGLRCGDTVQRWSRVQGLPFPANAARSQACVLPRITSGHSSPRARLVPVRLDSPYPQNRRTDDRPEPPSASAVRAGARPPHRSRSQLRAARDIEGHDSRLGLRGEARPGEGHRPIAQELAPGSALGCHRRWGACRTSGEADGHAAGDQRPWFDAARAATADVPHLSRSIWAPTSGGVGRAVDAGGDV